MNIMDKIEKKRKIKLGYSFYDFKSLATIDYHKNRDKDNTSDYSTPDNYFESKRAEGWYGGIRR